MNLSRLPVIALAAVLSACSLTIPAATPATETESDTPDTQGGSEEVVDDVVEDTASTPTCQCGAPFCRTEGLCKASKPVCEQGTDGTCAWNCDYPANFVEAEGDTDCDGEDNDCDGVIDDVAPRASDPITCSLGVCESAPSRCVAGAWVCEDAAVPGRETEESLCDGKDNDCDGETDETLAGTAVDCGFEGVCAQVTGVECVNGQWACGVKKAEAPGYEVTETRCDGLDNDCDGIKDKGLIAGKSACNSAGVCGLGAAVATCTAGAWSCNYGGVAGYQAVESTCDGQDNDCDGLTDEGVPAQDVASCDPAAKAKATEGVCVAGASVSCLAGNLLCDFDSIPTYEGVESSCDGLDNDCDGQTDESLTDAPPGTCSVLGVCALGSSTVCEGGVWRCAFEAIPAYESIEASCDNVDNDCDGQTDEGVQVAASECPAKGQGLCATQAVAAKCEAGKKVCDFGAVVGYEVTETSCDAVDNDCDGLTDEQIGGAASSLPGATCKRLGVCAEPQKVIASCTDGEWACSYAQLGAAYQAGDETLCDGKDNDCDGVIDEDIHAAGHSTCTQGVCAGNTSSTCIAGEFKCDFGGIVGYENPESSCDGKDNNCDGETDEGACPNLARCTSPSQCKSGVCRETPDGLESCCVATDDLCPSAGCSAARNVGETDCLEADLGKDMSWYVASCSNAGWSVDPDTDRCSTGACADGVCRECVPGQLVCSGLTEILPCTEDGEYGDAVLCPPTPVGTTCETYPSCVCNADQQLSSVPVPDGYDMREISIAAITETSQYAVWTTSPAKDTTNRVVVGRLISSNGCAEGNPTYTIYNYTAPSGASETRVLSWGNNTVVVAWRERTGSDSGNVRLRAINVTGAPPSPQAATFGTSTRTGEQGQPALVKAKNNTLVVAFSGVGLPGGNGTDIAVQTIPYLGTGNLTGPAVGSTDKVVNSPPLGEQTDPALAALDDGRVLVAWTDGNLEDGASPGVYARLFEPGASLSSGTFVGVPFPLHATTVGDQRHASVAARAGGFVAAWASSHGGDDNVFVRAFTNSGSAKSGEVLVSREANGTPAIAGQRKPAVAIVDEAVVVLYEDETHDLDANAGGSVWFVQFDRDLNFVNARLINQDETLNRQLRPALAPALDANGVGFALVGFETENKLGVDKNGVFVRPVVLAPEP